MLTPPKIRPRLGVHHFICSQLFWIPFRLTLQFSLGKCSSHYDKDRREILLASPDAKVFFHELSHVAMERLGDSITHT